MGFLPCSYPDRSSERRLQAAPLSFHPVVPRAGDKQDLLSCLRELLNGYLNV